MNRITAWGVDYLHMLKGQALMHYHRNPPAHYLGFVKEKKAPVILIPGIMEKWGFLKPLGDSISLAGHPVYIVPSLEHNLLNISEAANYVRNVIDENQLSNVVIVAHSKGGLIGKYLLVYHNNDKKIKKLIGIATPFGGSPLTKAIPHRAFGELRKESAVITDLKVHTEVNKYIISLYPVFDNHVLSKERSMLDGAENIRIPVYGHHKILFDKNVQEKIIHLIH